ALRTNVLTSYSKWRFSPASTKDSSLAAPLPLVLKMTLPLARNAATSPNPIDSKHAQSSSFFTRLRPRFMPLRNATYLATLSSLDQRRRRCHAHALTAEQHGVARTQM